jgi:hypothetical protein
MEWRNGKVRRGSGARSRHGEACTDGPLERRLASAAERFYLPVQVVQAPAAQRRCKGGQAKHPAVAPPYTLSTPLWFAHAPQQGQHRRSKTDKTTSSLDVLGFPLACPQRKWSFRRCNGPSCSPPLRLNALEPSKSAHNMVATQDQHPEDSMPRRDSRTKRGARRANSQLFEEGCGLELGWHGAIVHKRVSIT